jgi:hypothetical protein
MPHGWTNTDLKPIENSADPERIREIGKGYVDRVRIAQGIVAGIEKAEPAK